MSYNYAESATLTTAVSGLVIASDAYMTESPDYKIATLSGGGAVYSGATVISGGTVYLGSGTIMNNATIGPKGSVFASYTGRLSGVTIESGGYVGNAPSQNNPQIFDFTIKSGGTLAFTNGSMGGRNNSAAANTFAGNLRIASDSVDGVLYGVTQTGGAFTFTNIVFSNFINSGTGYSYIASGCSIYNGSAIKDQRGFAFAGSAYLHNAYVSGGWIWTGNAGAAISLGGAQTYIKQGSWYHCGAGNSASQDTNLYASGGVLYGVTVKNSGNWLKNLTILSGLTISAPVVSNGGILTIGASGYATNVNVIKGGKTVVSTGGSVSVITVAGTAEIWGTALVSSVTVQSGGLVSMANTGATFRNGLTIESGGHAYIRTCNISGVINVKAGTLSGNVSVASDSIDGVAYGFTQTGGALNYFAGAVISGYLNNGACYTYIGAGAKIANGSALKNNGGFGFLNGGYLCNVWISGGSLWTQHTAGAACSLGGAETYIKQGQVYHCAAAGSANHDLNMYAENGVLYGVKLVSSGLWLKNLTILEDLTISAPAISSGGTLTLISGGTGTDVVVTGTGKCNVSNGGRASNVNISGVGNVSGLLNIMGGGYASGVTLSGTNGDSNYIYMYGGVLEDFLTDKGGVYLAGGGTVSNFTQRNGALVILRGPNPFASNGTVSGGTLYFQNGAKGADIVVLAGGMQIHDNGNKSIPGSGAQVSGADIRGGTIQVFAGGKLLDARLSGGTINVTFTANYSAARISGITQYSGTINVNSGAFADDVTVNRGTLTVAAGGTVNNLTVNETAAANGITVRGQVNDLVMSGAGMATQALTLSAGGTISGGMMYGSFGVNHIYMYGGNINDFDVVNGNLYQVAGGSVTNLRQSGGQVIARGSNAIVSGVTVLKGEGQNAAEFYAQNGGSAFAVTVSSGGLAIAEMRAGLAHGTDLNPTIFDVDVLEGGVASVFNGGIFNGIRVSGGTVAAGASGRILDVTVTDGKFTVTNGATASGVEVTGGNMSAGGRVTALNVAAGGALTLTGNFTFEGDISFEEGTLTNDADAKAANGLIEDLDLAVNGTFGSGITLSNFTHNAGVVTLVSGAAIRDGAVSAGSAILNGEAQAAGFEQFGGRVIARGAEAAISSATVYGGNMSVANGAAFNEATISGGIVVVRHASGWAYDNNLTATASDVLIEGGCLQLESGGILTAGKLAAGADLTIYKGGKAALTSAAAGAEVNISFWDVNAGHGNTEAIITDWGDFSADAKVNIYTIETGYSYKIADVANANVTLDCGPYRTIFDDAVKTGGQYSNAFLGRNLDFSDGTTLVVSDFTVGTAAAAAKFSATTATSLADGGFAAKWNGDTTYAGGNLTIADANLNGNVWLTLDGFDQSAANIYGAEGAFNHDVNMWLYDGTVKNLAAGAKLGGSVDNVNILISDTGENGMKITNAMYAGGMGDVTGEIEAIVYGGEFGGNVFAGALCNYVANNTATDTGAISFTVNGGTFNNNIYAGAAVKAGAATGVVHTADDITLTLNGGTATKGAFCVYGGGYATGTTEDALVYTAGDVDISIAGGAWGEYVSGRGIFGGVYADKIAASVGNVEISVTDGTLGNIYGGGWAQNGGTSTVGDVSITVTGSAEVANVFGGGSYSSTSGGSTSVDNVVIVISGGTISGNIFAAGQGEFSTVTGDVSVTFMGANDYACNVYGYGVPTSATTSADKTLAFDSYTGTISGAVGGFDGIVLSGNTAATLTGAIDNSDWTFDYTDRTAGADTAMLTFYNGELTGEVAVDLSTVAQAEDGWSIAAGLDSAVAAFGVELATGSASGLRLNDTLDSSYGIYEGWGFTLEESTLKFKQLA